MAGQPNSLEIYADFARNFPHMKLQEIIRAIGTLFPEFGGTDAEMEAIEEGHANIDRYPGSLGKYEPYWSGEEDPPLRDEYGRIYPHWYDSRGNFTPSYRFENIWNRKESDDMWGR